TTENGESFNEINPTIKWYNETAQIAEGNDTTLPQPIVAQQSTGFHQFMAVASKTYYDDGKRNVTVIITSLSEVMWISPTGIIPYPNNFTPTCFVKDQASQSGISDYTVNFSYKWEPSEEFIFNGSYQTNATGYASYNFTPTQKGNITFNCTIGNNITQYYTAAVPSVAETIWVSDLDYPKIYNISILPNESLEANLNSTNITATIEDNYQINSVWANITMPNGSIAIVSMNNISIPEISFGLYRAIYSANYIPPMDGVYNISIYAKDAGPEYNVNYTYAGNISVWGKINALINQEPTNITVFGINQTHGYTFTVNVNFTNLGPATAYQVNLTHQEDPTGSLIYNETFKNCGTLYANQICSWTFEVTVPEKTIPGLINAYTIGSWRNPDLTYNQTTNSTDIIVSSNPVLEVSPTSISQTAPHDKTTTVGNFTTISAGNDRLINIQISLLPQFQPGNIVYACPSCVVTIVPSETGLLEAGENMTSTVSIQIPAGQSPGNYWSYINVSSSNAGEKYVFMNVTVPTNNSWNRMPETFGTISAPPNTNGTIGLVNISNIGNVKLQFQVYRSGDNGYLRIENSSIVPYAFELEKQSTRSLLISWVVPINAVQQLWNATLTISSSGSPTTRTINLTLDTRDVPPTISDVIVYPTQFEAGYEDEKILIQANVTDNIAVSHVWANITMPNGTTIILPMQNFTLNTYNTTYQNLTVGTHQIRICANDSASLTNCIEPINVTSSDTTLLSVIPNVTIINATNITKEGNQSFAINFSVNNLGYSRALNANVSIITPESIIALPDNFSYGTILKNTSLFNETIITVLNATQPGIYYVNFTANWTNLNNSDDSSITTLVVNVTRNPLIKILESGLSKVIYPGTTETANITLVSIGNDNATNVSLNCIEGIVCNNFTVIFEPENISLMPIDNVTYVNISFTVPYNYPTGIHTGTIAVNWSDSLSTQNFSTTLPVSINVPANISWVLEPSEIHKRVFDNETGIFGEMNISNVGNANISLNITVNGTIAPYLILDKSINVSYGETKTIYINYASPSITYDTNYTGFIVTNLTGELRENATEKEKAIFVSLFVTPYNVKIIYPTQSNPIVGINPYNIIQAKVNVTENGTIVSSNTNFTVKIFNNSLIVVANVTNYIFSQNVWLVNFTAPDLALGRVYNLNVTATHNETYNNTRSAVEHEAIVYNDTTAPLINISLPIRVPVNTTLNIKVNVTESGGLKNISTNITQPNNYSEIVNLNLITRDNDIYVYEYNFTNTTQLGNYTVYVKACDLSGNCNEASSMIEIYPIAIISGYTKNLESISETPMAVNFKFYDIDGSLRFNFTSNSTTGYYNETIDAKTYNLEINTFTQGSINSFTNTIKLYNSNISQNYYDPILLGNIPKARTTSSAFKGIYINNALPYSSAVLVIDFSECLNNMCGIPIYDPLHLGIYKYNGNWTPKITTAQNTLWTRISNVNYDNSDNSVNLTSLTVSANVSSLNGAYILAEFICGDGECESSYGESTNNCPTDCVYVPP
ncbi:MAG: hypothetical protein QXZ20_02095, partial [Candidatus Aenigmatarchaeota archaeon]